MQEQSTSAARIPQVLTLDCLPVLEDNYIWILRDERGVGVVVDPGEAPPVLEAIDRGLRPAAVLVTHHHPDHIGGLPELMAACSAPVYAPDDPRIPHATHRVVDGDVVEVAELGLRFTVIGVPGHTRSHVAYHDGVRLFCGDTLFSLGCGRLFEGSPGQMLASLDRLAGLADPTLVCCTHEYTLANGRFACVVEPQNPALADRIAQARAARARGMPSLPSTLAAERACNPFLRLDAPAVRAALRARQSGATDDRVSRFAALRRWKDGFGG